MYVSIIGFILLQALAIADCLNSYLDAFPFTCIFEY
jgi:hypothetical protein